MQIHELKLAIAHPEQTTQDLRSSEFEDAILEAVKGYLFENCSVQVDLVRSYRTGYDTTTEKVGFPEAQKRGKKMKAKYIQNNKPEFPEHLSRSILKKLGHDFHSRFRRVWYHGFCGFERPLLLCGILENFIMLHKKDDPCIKYFCVDVINSSIDAREFNALIWALHAFGLDDVIEVFRQGTNMPKHVRCPNCGKFMKLRKRAELNIQGLLVFEHDCHGDDFVQRIFRHAPDYGWLEVSKAHRINGYAKKALALVSDLEKKVLNIIGDSWS